MVKSVWLCVVGRVGPRSSASIHSCELCWVWVGAVSVAAETVTFFPGIAGRYSCCVTRPGCKHASSRLVLSTEVFQVSPVQNSITGLQLVYSP